MYYKCPPNQIIYKYLPRTLSEELDNPVPLKISVGEMWDARDPWFGAFGLYQNDMNRVPAFSEMKSNNLA
jgi:hypothetical protein